MLPWFVGRFQSGMLNVQELAELPGERLCFSSNPARCLSFSSGEGRVSELLRKPVFLFAQKLRRVQRAGG